MMGPHLGFTSNASSAASVVPTLPGWTPAGSSEGLTPFKIPLGHSLVELLMLRTNHSVYVKISRKNQFLKSISVLLLKFERPLEGI